jgi:4-amino-4-deoxy-L-arabinose transferase-like glycosyltransferase
MQDAASAGAICSLLGWAWPAGQGPLAIVLVGMPIFFWVLLRNGWKAMWQRLPWISGSLLMLAIALPWYLLAEYRTPGFLNYFIMGEHVSRFL